MMDELVQQRIESLLFKRTSEIEIRNMMGRYCNYHAQFRQDKCCELFDLADETAHVEMAWGIYDGEVGIRKCYGERHCQHSDPDRWRGKLFFRTVCTPCIEISGDGKTARASWLTPGVGSWENDEVPGEVSCNWGWCKYGIDYKLVDGHWKWWHLHVFSLFNAEYERCWTDLPAYSYEDTSTVENFSTDWKENEEDGMPDRPISIWWNYEAGSVYPSNQPEVPEPYHNFEQDIGAGW